MRMPISPLPRPATAGVTAAGLVGGFVLDALVGDPRRGHPVALFGRGAAALEDAMWADSRARGLAYCGALVGSVALAGAVVECGLAGRPVARGVAVAVGTWAVLGGRSLAAEGAAMAALLREATSGPTEQARDEALAPARERLSHLCSRDAADLDADALARATIESLAENTSDAVTAPLLWGALAGLPGLLAYRAANTLDAMVGYRSARHREFGWASARLDDLLNLAPARLAAALTLACAPLVSGDARAGARAWRRDAPAHPSPNAGAVEAAFAGALGVRLGGTNTYDAVREERGCLGDGPEATVADVPRAVALSRLVGAASLAVATGLALGLGRVPKAGC